MQTFFHRSGHLDLDRTIVMGILNVTPDSFSDGGRYLLPEKALEHALQIQEQGAGILDVGAQSTRPGHIPVSPEEEKERLLPVLRLLKGPIRIPISVDTYYPDVAQAALLEGASILNDVSGRLDNGMMELAARTGAGLILMHAGDGADDTGTGEDVLQTVRVFFERALDRAARVGLDPRQICRGSSPTRAALSSARSKKTRTVCRTSSPVPVSSAPSPACIKIRPAPVRAASSIMPLSSRPDTSLRIEAPSSRAACATSG